MLGCWQDPIANSNLIPAAPIRLTLANKFVITMVLVEVSWAIVSHPVAAARVLSRRNAGKLSWRKAASKRRSEVGFIDWTLGQDNRKFFWWMVLALSVCDQQDWPVHYSYSTTDSVYSACV